MKPTAKELLAAFLDGSPNSEVLAMAREITGKPSTCSICERELLFAKATCRECVLLVQLVSKASEAAHQGSHDRYLVLWPDGQAWPMAQRTTSMGDSVSVDLRGEWSLQVKTAARLRRPDVLERTRAERSGN